jgi:hypothetical protein
VSTKETYPTRQGPATSGPMNPAGAAPASFEAWQARVAPGDVFRYPRDVLAHPSLSRGEKRAILASWASDACALENAPALRCLAGCRAEPVCVDAVLAALARLDREEVAMPPRRKAPRKRPRCLSNLQRFTRPRRPRDDDDPPPCPVGARPRPRTPPDAALALALPA